MSNQHADSPLYKKMAQIKALVDTVSSLRTQRQERDPYAGGEVHQINHNNSKVLDTVSQRDLQPRN
jgi:hypothetical protein